MIKMSMKDVKRYSFLVAKSRPGSSCEFHVGNDGPRKQTELFLEVQHHFLLEREGGCMGGAVQ